MLMRSTMIAGALLAAAAIAATGVVAQAQKAEAPAQQEAPQWPEFQWPERGFAVSFPSTPQMTSVAVAGQNPLVRYSFEAYEGDDTVYRVVVLEYPAGKAPNPPSEAFYVKMVS